MGAAEDIYHGINKLEDIQAFITDQTEEDAHLDFKLSQALTGKGQTIKDSKKIYAKALSGFSNSDGGVIVWGVDARKNQDGIDAASDLKPIENLDRFMSDLSSLQTHLLDPPNDLIQHKPIRADNGSGYAVSLIPFSNSGPHMGKGPKSLTYYRRSGDSFFPMDHWEVKNAFFRQQSPDLELFTKITCGPINKIQGSDSIIATPTSTCLIVGLRNKGKAIAKFASLQLNFVSNHRGSRYGIDGSGNTVFINQPIIERPPYWEVYSAPLDTVIHPNTEIPVQSVDIKLIGNRPLTDLEFNYRIVAEYFPLTEGTYRISGDDIKREAIIAAKDSGQITDDMQIR